MKKVFIDSVGCTENIIDGAIMKNIAMSHGFEPSTDPEDADLLIINTCAAKKHQEDLCLKAIKRYEEKKKNGAELVVCGCLVSINKERLDEIFSGFSFPPSDLVQIYDAVHAPAPGKIEEAHYIPRDISDSEMFHARRKVEIVYSAKKYLKKKIGINFFPNFDYFDYIGDDKTIFVRVSRGCLNNCGYCAVRYAQGKLQSVPVSSIIETISKGIGNGYDRVFLIGTNTAHYGLDIGTNFFDLLEKVQQLDGEFKIIVHNYEPFGIQDNPDAFEKFFSSDKMLSLFFPLQSGSQTVLKRMNRKYEIDAVIKSLQSLRKLNRDVLIRTEFIIGYPGESWSEFAETVSTAMKFKFNEIDLHVFSSRPGTDAAALDGHVGALMKYSRFFLISVLIFFRTTIRKLRPV